MFLLKHGVAIFYRLFHLTVNFCFSLMSLDEAPIKKWKLSRLLAMMI